MRAHVHQLGLQMMGLFASEASAQATLVDMAQPKIDMAVEWGAQNGLSFSVDKTTVVFFSRQQKFHKEVLPKLKKLTINGVDINPSESMTYLGIVLDQKLSWTPHIQRKVSKAKKNYT